MPVTTTNEKITPAKAEQWLNSNCNNRSLREGVVEAYADDMRNGNWTRCTQPIAFYEDGDLADGQHRLYAIVESATTQEFIVMRGLSRRDGLNIDTGLARTIVDNARISGIDIDLSNNLVAAARAIELGETGGGGKRMTNAQKLAVVNEHREAAQWAISNLPRAKNIYNAPMLAGIGRAWYIESDMERLAQFCKVVGTGFGDGVEDSAAIAMRNYLLSNAGMASTSTMWRDTFLKGMNAIKYFMNRRRLTIIKSVSEEVYPLKKKKAPVARKVA